MLRLHAVHCYNPLCQNSCYRNEDDAAPPQNQTVSAIARETGLSEGTLHQWRRQAQAKGMAVLGSEQETERWSTQDKFLIVM